MSECILSRRMDAKHVDSSQPNLRGAIFLSILPDIIGSNYVRYDAETSPDHRIWNHSPSINSPWIILMTASHSCINTRGKMYDSSVLVWAPWPPTNRWTYRCPKMTLFKTTLSYIKWICRFFAIAILKVLINMCLNGIAIYLHDPLIAVLKISVLLVISRNIQVLRHICQMV